MASTILVVDDRAPNRELICEAQDSTAYEISEAANASEALDHLRRHKTDSCDYRRADTGRLGRPSLACSQISKETVPASKGLNSDYQKSRRP